MKKLFVIMLCVFILSGCLSKASVELNGITYKTDFYGDLFVMDLEREDEPVLSDENNPYENFYRVTGVDTNLLITYDGGVKPELYCPENEWEDRKAYYENPDNFTYYCNIDNVKYEICDIDIEKYNSLITFIEENRYIPFAYTHNNKAETKTMPIPVSAEYAFYKESNDKLLKSSTGDKFLVVGEKLILLFYYDYNHGESEPECVYVDVPQDLSDYFLKLISGLQ